MAVEVIKQVNMPPQVVVQGSKPSCLAHIGLDGALQRRRNIERWAGSGLAVLMHWKSLSRRLDFQERGRKKTDHQFQQGLHTFCSTLVQMSTLLSSGTSCGHARWPMMHDVIQTW